MNSKGFPESIYDLKQLSSDNFSDIVCGSNERFPDLRVIYKTLDERFGVAMFGQFFFFGDCMYLLRSIEEPDEDSNLDVFIAVFENYYAPEHHLAWNDCKRVEFYSIMDKEEYEMMDSLPLTDINQTPLSNARLCEYAWHCGDFDYYVQRVCERSLPLVQQAMKDDLPGTFFDFLKRALAFHDTWDNLHCCMLLRDPFPSYEEFETEKRDLMNYYLMPFEKEPIVMPEEEYNFGAIQKIINRLNDIPEIFGWEFLEGKMDKEETIR